MPNNAETYESVIKENHAHSLTIDTKSMRKYVIGTDDTDGSLACAIERFATIFGEIRGIYEELANDPLVWMDDDNKLAWMNYIEERFELVKIYRNMLWSYESAIKSAMDTYDQMHDEKYQGAENYTQTAWWNSA